MLCTGISGIKQNFKVETAYFIVYRENIQQLGLLHTFLPIRMISLIKATGLIFSLFDVTSAQEMPFGIPQYVQCILHGLTSVFLLFSCSQTTTFSFVCGREKVKSGTVTIEILLHATTKSMSEKMNETQRRTLESPLRMHCTYCGMPKGTYLAEAMSNSEKINPVVLAVIELRLSEGISQLLSQSILVTSKKIHSNLLKAI